MHEARLLALVYARGERGIGRPNEYWREVLGDKPPPYPKEWCGAFALWCLHGAGIAKDVLWVSGIGFLSHVEGKKLVWSVPKVTTPEPGDIAYFDKPYQHHALVESLDPAPRFERDGFSHAAWTLRTIDGNQPDVRNRTRSHIPTLHESATFFSIAPWLPPEPSTEPCA